MDRLDRYREMRDFSKTAEPSGESAPEPSEKLRFVVQEHHATALHWDFRLERDGVLPSWAVPKGIPADPKVNHLAVQTEDHPLSYIDFEGGIPADAYGGGNVILWDRGTYELVKWWENEVQVVLHGQRIQGKYVLFRTDGKNWMIHRMDPPQDPGREPMPKAIEPMLAKPGAALPRETADYVYETKWDGVRALAFIDGGRIRLQSRSLLDLTKQFPEFHELGAAMGAREMVLDGEIVAFNDEGVPSFERLQNRLNLSRPGDVRRRMAETPVVYMVFDLLYLDGRSTMALPYRERRLLLEGLALNGPIWRTPPFYSGDPKPILEGIKVSGLEGIVAKRVDSAYEPGRRSGAWTKHKNSLSQEFVIGGWTPGAGNRGQTLGALLLGYYDRTRTEAEAAGVAQRFHFAGKVGTGFNDRLLAHLLEQLGRRRRAESPYDVGVPEPGAVFVEPELVAEVDFLEWTEAGTLRHPSFKGLRTDKVAGDVVLEETGGKSPASGEVVGRAGPGGRKAAREPRVVTASPGVPPRAVTPAGAGMAVMVEGHQLSLTNLEKPLYPTGFTKAQVIDYYTRIAPYALPHYRGRQMTRKRYPDGSQGPFFYEKDAPSHTPAWVHRSTIFSGSSGRNIDFILADDLATLVWLANLAALELHPSLALAVNVEQPTSVVFDLDPGAPADIVDCCDVALALRDLFGPLGLQCFPKTSGSKGMQVYLPLNTPATYEQTKPFAHAIARLLERQNPKGVVSNMSKAVRTGKVFVDWSQNDQHKTTVGVYSLRAREVPSVSTPLTWDDVERCAAVRDGSLLHFEAPDVLERVARLGDLFVRMVELRQGLPAVP